MKKAKKANPYKKKQQRRIRITRKQWTTIVGVLAVVAVLVGIILLQQGSDPHAGHNHAEGDGNTVVTDEHGHAADSHGTTQSNTAANDKVKYQTYTNEDGTYRLVIRDSKNSILFEQDKLERMPARETVNADKGVYALSWALYKDPADNGPNDFASVYYNVKTGEVSQLFLAPRGCDGVRVVYGSEDQTKVIVQDLFDKEAYYKEHALENPEPNADGDIIVGGQLKGTTAIISYVAAGKSSTQHTTVPLYE